MKRLFITLITFAAYTASILAAGSLRDGGKTLTDQGRSNELNSWLTNICGATKSYRGTWSISSRTAPQNNAGDVYFVGINHYWKGETSGSYSPYDEINNGVDKIEKVSDDGKLTTSSGTFYTYEAKNANKFFFIVRRSTARSYSFNVAFKWYDEWSYVSNTSGGYTELSPCYDKLKDGAPFFSPHNCETSLETNHYITLNDKEDDSETAKKGYNFTAFLYIPKTVNSSQKIIPYVFFYTVNLNGTRSAKHSIASQFDCPYDAILNWSTSFDKYQSQVPKTKYNGMKEHYVIERSYDRINWETVENVADVENDNVASAASKTFTDKNLKDFDETTAKIGYTVYYRLTSVIQKTDGTEMARRTAPQIATIIIPGSSPFSISLQDGSKSAYNPGYMDNNDYIDGTNDFTNTIIASETSDHDDVILAKGATLQLIRTSNGTSEVVSAYEVTDASMSLADLARKIGNNGTFTETFNTAAGKAKDAQYQLQLTIGNDHIYSNIVDIVGNKVENAVVSAHRSGTPDKATCADTELYANEMTFKPANTGIGTGYHIYCNGEKVLTLTDNGNLTFSDENNAIHKVNAQGYLTITINGESNPIAVGESNICDDFAEFNYALVHFDNNTGNTYGSAAETASFSGTKDELVVNLTEGNKGDVRVGYDYNNAYIRPVLSWVQTKTNNDVKAPIRYEIFRKVEKAPFERLDMATSEYISEVKVDNPLNITDGILNEYVKVAEVASNVTSYRDEFYYRRKPQTNYQAGKLSDDELRPTSYYIKAIYAEESDNVAQNIREKNSDIITLNLAEGSIFTAISDVHAEDMSVTAQGGYITVTGVTGEITVYNADGKMVASADGNGDTTEIEAGQSGVYFVKAAGYNTTKILIK